MKEDLVKKLVESGLTKKEAESKVKALYEKMSEMGIAEEDQDKLAKRKVLAFLSEPGESITGLCLGITEKKDANDYTKNQALEMYKKDKNMAVVKGIVRVEEDGTVTPLDSLRFFDEAQTKKNPNFGKPLKTRIQRSAMFLIEGNLKTVFGDFDAVPGNEYTFKGTVKKDKDYISGARKFVVNREVMDPTDIFGMAMKACAESAFREDIENLPDLKKGAMVALIGEVSASGEKSNGGVWLRLMDLDTETFVICFADEGNSIPEQFSTAIVIGKKGTMTDDDTGEETPLINTLAIVEDPSSVISYDTAELDSILDE